MEKKKNKVSLGMQDILPGDYDYFAKVCELSESCARFYKFSRMETSLFEKEDLFKEKKRLKSDEQKAFVFQAKDGDFFKLRAEPIVSLARAFVENNMTNMPRPVKLWYAGRFFKNNGSSEDEFQETMRLGFEIFGSKDLIIDAQIIQIFFGIFGKLGIKDLAIELNSIGDSKCRPYYKKVLKDHLKSSRYGLCLNCRKALKINPLKVFSCKEEKCQRVIKTAPQIIDHLCKKCHNHFRGLLEFLDEMGIPYHLNPYLVRTAEYYTRTVFDIFRSFPESPELKELFVKGGRHDLLVKMLGGKDVSACGGSLDAIKLAMEIKRKQERIEKSERPQVFLAQLGKLAKRKGLILFEELGMAKIETAECFERNSLKYQLDKAKRLGVKYVLLIGQKEAINDCVVLKNIETGEQRTFKMDEAAKEVKEILKKDR